MEKYFKFLLVKANVRKIAVPPRSCCALCDNIPPSTGRELQLWEWRESVVGNEFCLYPVLGRLVPPWRLVGGL